MRLTDCIDIEADRDEYADSRRHGCLPSFVGPTRIGVAAAAVRFAPYQYALHAAGRVWVPTGRRRDWSQLGLWCGGCDRISHREGGVAFRTG